MAEPRWSLKFLQPHATGTGGKAAGAEDGHTHLLSKLRIGGFHRHVRHNPSCWDGYLSTEVQRLMCISRRWPVHSSDSYEHCCLLGGNTL
jgi:hypothetical protein